MDIGSHFNEKTVLVTGSGRGIGRAVALHFASLGANLVINFFRNRAPAEDTAKEVIKLGKNALVVKANIGEIDEIQFLIEETNRFYGGLDILVHSAASGYNRPALQQKPKGWDWTVNINARSLLFCAQYALPLMKTRGGGAIVAVSSPGSQRVLPDYIVVGASKAALESVIRYLAVELSPHNIVVNGVSPGLVLTEALKHFGVVQKSNTAEYIKQFTPARRLVTPEDIAGVIAFLCSPQAQMIRGQFITIDGGITLLGPGVQPTPLS